MGRFNSRLNTDEDKIINVKGESEEYIQTENWRDKNNAEKKMIESKEYSNMFQCLFEIQEGDRENKREKIFEVITTENFPKLSKV